MGVYLYPNNTETPLKNAYIGIPNPTSIVLNKFSISLTTVGQTEQLTATIEPTVSDKNITWSSDDTTVATVSTTGLVTCVTPGTCTITATTVNGLTASCSVDDNQGWQPGANTIAYYPLNGDTNDYSGNNRNLTNNGISFGNYNGVDCANMTSNVYAYSTDIPLPSGANSRTISFWFYDTSRVNDTYWCAYGSHSNGRFFAPRINNSKYSFMGYARDFDTSTTVSTGVWKLITVTYDGATVKYYLNGGDIGSSSLSLDTTAVGSTRKFVIGCRLDRYANPNQYVTGYMSNMILEDKARTAQEIADYYNSTKSDYGL